MEFIENGAAKAAERVFLDVGGQRFTVSKSTLLRIPETFFTALLGNDKWLPDKDGIYFIDRNPEGFQEVLDFLRTGELWFDDLSPKVAYAIRAHFDYFLIPLPELTFSPWVLDQNTFTKKYVRVCGRFLEWNIPENYNEENSLGPLLILTCIQLQSVTIRIHEPQDSNLGSISVGVFSSDSHKTKPFQETLDSSAYVEIPNGNPSGYGLKTKNNQLPDLTGFDIGNLLSVGFNSEDDRVIFLSQDLETKETVDFVACKLSGDYESHFRLFFGIATTAPRGLIELAGLLKVEKVLVKDPLAKA